MLKLPIPCFEIHSRKTQAARTNATNAFTKASSGILLSSDVTARGIDIPGVTAVIQIGMPSSGEQCKCRSSQQVHVIVYSVFTNVLTTYNVTDLYAFAPDIHRLGRTARAGNEGSGMLILAPWERRFLLNKDITQLPLTQVEPAVDLVTWKGKVNASMEKVDDKLRAGAYQVSSQPMR